MGTIKDIVELSTQLANSVSDRKIATELNNIQSLTLKLQSEQVNIHEQNMKLREDLIIEKEKSQRLSVLVKKLESQLEVKGKIQYEKPSYWLIDGDQKDGPFCQRCYDVENRLVRLQGDDYDYWRCRDCKNGFCGPKFIPHHKR